MRLMKLAERAHTVVAEKLGRVEHAPQETFHAVPAGERDQPALAHAGFVPARNQAGEIRPVFEIPLEAAFEIRHGIDHFRLNRVDREQRH